MTKTRGSRHAALRLVLCPGLLLLPGLAPLMETARAQAPASPPPRPFDLGGALRQPAPLVLPPASGPAGISPDGKAGALVAAPLPPARPRFATDLAFGPAKAQAGAPDAAPQEQASAPDEAPVAIPPPEPAKPVSQAEVAAASPPPQEGFAARLRSWFAPADKGEDDEEDEWPRRTRGQRASLNVEPPFDPNEKPERPGLSTDPGVSTKCLPEILQTVLQKVIARYGAVKVTSTYRPAWRARRGSYHRRCEAVDFRVPGVRPGEVLAVVKDYEETGGHKVYWNGLIHVDTGPYRTWRGARR